MSDYLKIPPIDKMVKEYDDWFSNNYIRLLELNNMEGVKEIYLKWKDLGHAHMEKLIKRFEDLLEECNEIDRKHK